MIFEKKKNNHIYGGICSRIFSWILGFFLGLNEILLIMTLKFKSNKYIIFILSCVFVFLRIRSGIIHLLKFKIIIRPGVDARTKIIFRFSFYYIEELV